MHFVESFIKNKFEHFSIVLTYVKMIQLTYFAYTINSLGNLKKKRGVGIKTDEMICNNLSVNPRLDNILLK